MDVLVTPDVPTSKHVRYMQKLAAAAMKSNSAWMAVGEEPWELVALIVPGETADQLMVTFALRSSADNRIRAVVGATPDGQPIEIGEILQSTDGYLDPELFLNIATRACEVIGEAYQHQHSNTVH